MRALLGARAALDYCDPDEGAMALHVAAFQSSSTVVALLLDAKCAVNALDIEADTPLLWCCTRSDDQVAVQVAQVLADHGALLDHKVRLLAKIPTKESGLTHAHRFSVTLSCSCEIGSRWALIADARSAKWLAELG